MRLVVSGASGLLGLNMSLVAQKSGFDVTGLVNNTRLKDVPFNVENVDLLKTDKAIQIIKNSKPDGIIHCAAIANLNYAERHPDLTHELNSVVPGALAAAAAEWRIPFIHISTDAVFDGIDGNYRETDNTTPLSVYAKTKLEGERAVLDAYHSAVVARVVFFGWSLTGQRSLSEFFINNLHAGNTVDGYSDTFFSPLYVEDLAATLLKILNENLSGIYHIVSPQSLSKYEFGLQIAKEFGLNPLLIKPIQRQIINIGAQRSLNLVLNPEKIQLALGKKLPTVDEGIKSLHQRWIEGYPKLFQSYQVSQ